MKSLIVFFLLLFGSLSFAQKLIDRDSVWVFDPDDIIAMMIDSSGTYTWRYMSIGALANAISRIMVDEGVSDTVTAWKWYTAINRFSHIYPTADGSKLSGQSNLRWLWNNSITVYTDNLVITNAGDSTVAITMTFDGTNGTFDKPLKLSQDISSDSNIVTRNTVYGSYNYTIANTGDSVLTLMADTCAVIELILPGNVTNLENIIFNPDAGDGLGEGAVIRIFHKNISNTVFFEDAANTDDGSMQLAGDFTMAWYDYLELMHTWTGAYWTWIEISRSNN